MKEKGLDLSRAWRPRRSTRCPNLDHYQVIVALAEEARAGVPAQPAQGGLPRLEIEDPSAVPGTPEEVRAAYEATFQFIHEHIRTSWMPSSGQADDDRHAGDHDEPLRDRALRVRAGAWRCSLASSSSAAAVAAARAAQQGGGKTVIQNNGSDTMVNVAQAWAEEYTKVAPAVASRSRAAARAWASPR